MTRRFFPDSCVEVDSIGDQDAFSCDDAEVWMEGHAILVSYFDEDGIVVLEGLSENGSDYTLMARSRPRSATLARVSGEGVGGDAAVFPEEYVGSISEQGETAHWKLTLGTESSGESSE